MVQSDYYFDFAAASPLDERVFEVMRPYFSELFFNPSSPYEPAVRVRRDYQAAKDTIARTIGANADELVMCAGATESINMALTNFAGHTVYAATEHESVRHAAQANGLWAEVPVTKTGRVEPEAVRASITDQTQLVSVALANHELGTVQPIASIGRVIAQERERRLINDNPTPLVFHCDASQGFGVLDVHVGRLGVDLLTLNAGKIYGPKQVGLLWIRPGVTLRPTIVGGGQELGLRSGTENVAGVIGFAEAARIAEKKRKAEARRLAELRDEMQRSLLKQFPSAVVSGDQRHRLANFLHISFAEIDAERLIFILETKQVYVATGSACAANKGTGSSVLRAIGLDETLRQGSLRISLGRMTTKEQCDYAVQEICAAVQLEANRQGHHG